MYLKNRLKRNSIGWKHRIWLKIAEFFIRRFIGTSKFSTRFVVGNSNSHFAPLLNIYKYI